MPVSQLTAEDIALQGFSRDEDQDGQIDPLPAHLQAALAPQQPAFQQRVPQQQFAPQQQQQFIPQQQQQFAPQQFQQRPAFRTPQPVAPSPAGQPTQQQLPQLSQAQLNQFFLQQQQQQQQSG